MVTVAAQPATNPWCSTTPYVVAYTPPDGFSVTTASPAACPADNTTTPQFQPLVITATSRAAGPRRSGSSCAIMSKRMNGPTMRNHGEEGAALELALLS